MSKVISIQKLENSWKVFSNNENDEKVKKKILFVVFYKPEHADKKKVERGEPASIERAFLTAETLAKNFDEIENWESIYGEENPSTYCIDTDGTEYVEWLSEYIIEGETISNMNLRAAACTAIAREYWNEHRKELDDALTPEALAKVMTVGADVIHQIQSASKVCNESSLNNS